MTRRLRPADELNSSVTFWLSLLLIPLFLIPSTTQAEQRKIEQLSPEKIKKIQTKKLEEQYYPTLKFIAIEVQGDPMVLPENGENWQSLKEDQLLDEGARVSTLDGDTVQLKVPGISLIELDEKTEVILKNLKRRIQFGSKSDIFQFGSRPDASHSVRIKALDGDVHNSISDRVDDPDQNLEYKLETPQSVAGLRGTTFNCSVDRKQTECSVYEGRIHLASLKEPGLGRMLEAGYSSSVKKEETRPDTPVKISTDRKSQLQNLFRQKPIKLRLEPFVGNIVIAGKEPKQVQAHTYRTEINFSEPRTLKLLGEARAREPGASIKRVDIRYNGRTLPVEDKNEWAVTVRPDTLFPGQRRTLTFKIQATDDTGMHSLPQTLIVDLVNKDVANPIPRNYDKADVNVEITSIGRQKIKDAVYPFHLFLDDLERGKNVLRVVGEAGGYNPVRNVAYSLDQGVTWNLAEGTFQWEFDLPVNPSVKQELRPQLIAWTREKTIGDVHEAGPFLFHPKTFSGHLADQLRRFWQAFVNRNLQGIKNNIAERLHLEDQKSGLSIYRDRFMQSLQELFAVSRDMSVTTEILEAEAGRNHADMTYSLEVDGRKLGSNKHFKILGSNVYMHLQRGGDGRFLVQRITDLLTKRFMYTEGYETIRYGQGYDLNELEAQSRKVGLIQFNRYGENPEDWTLKLGNGVFQGGLLNLGSTSLARAYPLPDLNSTDYSSWVYIQPGNLYTLNARTKNGQITSFFRFKNLTKTSLDVQVYTIRKMPGF